MQRIDAIAADDAGEVFAVGISVCSTCAGLPLALKRGP
jgi:hypothetical protein